jgi:hypothetical protein
MRTLARHLYVFPGALIDYLVSKGFTLDLTVAAPIQTFQELARRYNVTVPAGHEAREDLQCEDTFDMECDGMEKRSHTTNGTARTQTHFQGSPHEAFVSCSSARL